jgi:hypothetical protein
MAIVYLTTNLINGKQYIGSSSFNRPSYFGSGVDISKAIKKYGKSNFKKEILWEGDDSLKFKIEGELLVQFDVLNNKNFYNKTIKAVGLTGGYKVKQWVKDKYREQRVERLLKNRAGFDKDTSWLKSEKGRAHILAQNKIINSSPEIIKKRGDSLKKRYSLIDHHMKGVPKSQEWKDARKKKIICYFPNGETMIFNYSSEVTNHFTMSSGTLYKLLKGREVKKYKGYSFKYYEA